MANRQYTRDYAVCCGNAINVVVGFEIEYQSHGDISNLLLLIYIFHRYLG